jgi:hypothetical protein
MEVQMISTNSSPAAEERLASKATLPLEEYISQYRGMSRFTRLLKIAETAEG